MFVGMPSICNWILLLGVVAQGALAAWDCGAIPVSGTADKVSLHGLPKLKDDLTFNLTQEISHGQISSEFLHLYGNVCGKTGFPLASAATKRCPDGTSICWMRTMRPEGAADELAVEVISLFNESAVPVLKVTSSDPAAAKTYALEMGPFKLTLVCKEGVDGKYSIGGKDLGKADVFEVRLEDKNVCALAKGAAPSGGSKGEGGKSMSGTGIFFLTIFVTTFAYFVIGSMYNYSVQRITDFPEMIPHIDAIKLGASKLIDFIFSLTEKFRSGSSTYIRI